MNVAIYLWIFVMQFFVVLILLPIALNMLAQYYEWRLRQEMRRNGIYDMAISIQKAINNAKKVKK